jgi:hypothetical protein
MRHLAQDIKHAKSDLNPPIEIARFWKRRELDNDEISGRQERLVLDHSKFYGSSGA